MVLEHLFNASVVEWLRAINVAVPGAHATFVRVRPLQKSEYVSTVVKTKCRCYRLEEYNYSALTSMRSLKHVNSECTAASDDVI